MVWSPENALLRVPSFSINAVSTLKITKSRTSIPLSERSRDPLRVDGNRPRSKQRAFTPHVVAACRVVTPPPAMGSRLEKNSQAVAKAIQEHKFENEEGEEYGESSFGGFSDYMRRKKLKLQNADAELRSQSRDKPQIFKGVVATVNGYTQPSLNDLQQLIVSHGGGFIRYLYGKTIVTHIIAAELTPKKAVEFKKYRIVKPAWIVDSVKAGKLLPWENYRVLDEGAGQKLLGFDSGKMVSQPNNRERGYRDQARTSWYTSKVKEVAEDIDDDSNYMPSSRPLPSIGAGSYSKSSPTPPKNTLEVSQRDSDDPEVTPSNPESYELTSSLEDALNAVTTEADPIVKNDTDNSSKPPKTLTPNDFAQAMEDIEDEVSPNLRKRPPSVEYTSPSKRQKTMTAEEHNVLLLADPHIRKSSTANPDFLRQFYSESRLHHLSTWKASLKAQFQRMAAEKSASQKQVAKRERGARRYIMHVDFDSFFCAVSLKKAPEYIDKPAVVAHGTGPGSEIASCNYPARNFGIKNGMWMKQALNLCPDIKVLPYDFPAYEEASTNFYEAVLNIGGVVQSVSVDEALVDITSLCLSASGSDVTGISEGSIWREQQNADEIAQAVRGRIKTSTGCAVSVGIGGNILLAKVALRKAKPAGQYQIKSEEVLDFIGELTVQRLPGVAHNIGGKLEEIGIKFVKDVRSLSKERLMTVLGPKTGEKLWEYARGIDRTEVGEEVVRKSVSAEVNWGIRFINQPEAEEFVQNLCKELQKRLLDSGVKGRQLTMKIMRKAADAPLDPPKHLGHGKCDTFNKSIVLGIATNSADIIGKEAVSILRSYGFPPGELRGLGVQMTKLEPIKISTDGRPEDSQKRITFAVKPPPPPRRSRQEIEDPIIDPDSPQKPKAAPVHPAAAITKANAADASAKKINLTGTQFLLPSQIDPGVLAELPLDIRSRLLAQSKSRDSSRASSRTPSRPPSRAQSPELQPRSERPFAHGADLPSQFDPEVFEALPPDMKAEVLASYSSKSTVARGQSAGLQPPKKIRPMAATKRQTTPTKKRGRPPGRGSKAKTDSNSTLTQSNFLFGRRDGSRGDQILEAVSEVDAIDPEFLAALPEEMRQEVIAEHKRARLAARSGLVTLTALHKKRKPEALVARHTITLPPRLPRPTFTTEGLSALPELRETISEWYKEFRDEGPHDEDVKAMERYLRRVILEEKNIAKAVDVVKWIIWVIDDDEEEAKGKMAWKGALDGVEEQIQKAVKERGIGGVEF
jgi:DNA repair protein REV1